MHRTMALALLLALVGAWVEAAAQEVPPAQPEKPAGIAAPQEPSELKPSEGKGALQVSGPEGTRDTVTAPVTPLTASPPATTGIVVTLVSSRTNQVALEKEGLDYRKGIRFWSMIAQKAGLKWRIAGDYELETGPAPTQVYVVHMAERLRNQQRKNLEKLRKGGTSMILVGMIGMYDEEGKRVPSLAEEWLQLKHVTEYTPAEAGYFTPRAGNVFALGNAPGFRFEYYRGGGRYFVAETRNSVAVNVDWTLTPVPDATSVLRNSVVALRTMENSRLAWFGVNPDAVAADPVQQEMITKTLVALLKWAAKLPVAGPCPWRDCHRSAAVVTADVEDHFGTGEVIALICHHEGVRGSFFLLGKLAPEYPEVVAALAQNGEVGTHSVEHMSFKGRPFEDQLAEMNNGATILRQLGVEKVFGFRPPMEEYDESTVRAVAAAGLGFIFGDLDYDRAYPSELPVNGSRVYQFPRVVADDYNLVTQRGVKDASGYRQEYLKEFHRLYEFGGLFPFSFHSQYLAMSDTADVIRTIIRNLKKSDVWITTFGEIVKWMEIRRHVAVEASFDQGVTIVTVRNDSEEEINGFPVRLFPPTEGGNVRLVATPKAGISLRSERDAVVISVDLVAGETRELKLR